MNTKRLFFILFLVFLISTPSLIHTQTMQNYCSAPPYVTRTAAPNIMVILDNSADMLQQAHPGNYNIGSPLDYKGYFSTDKKYCASTKYFYEAASCSGSDPGPYDGGLLNWATMSKYDILMQVLIGGLGSPYPSSRGKLKGVNTDWDPRTSSAYPGCIFDVTENGGLKISSTGACNLPLITSTKGAPIVIEIINRSPAGIIQQLIDENRDGEWDSDAPRLAFMRFDAPDNNVKMDWCAGRTDKISILINTIASYEATPDKNNSNAPLDKAITSAITYYKNKCGADCGCNDPSGSVRCRKNFIITIGSGNATDINSINGLMQKIKESHNSDIREDLEGTQVINFFAVDIFGTEKGREILKDIVKYGGFVDSNGNKNPDAQSEWDKDRDGIPDSYYEVSDADDMTTAMETAFQDILAGTASGTAGSNLYSQTKKAGLILQSYFLAKRYEGLREVLWTGHMQSLWLDRDANMREDSTRDNQLILDQDMVIKYYFNREADQTEAALFTTGDDGRGGTLASCGNPAKKPFADVKVLWEAGKKLHKTTPSKRNIFTSKKILRGAKIEKNISADPYPVFDIENKGLFSDALNADASYNAENIIRYIRGACLESGINCADSCCNSSNPVFRDRRVDGNVWKLGDIMNSSPKVFSGAPLNTYHIDYADRSYYDFISDTKYKQKSAIAFAGANDGMLHAFRAGYIKDTGLTGKIKAMFKDAGDSLGEELWAFIPYNAFPYLKYLARPDYCHLYYADLPVKVVDASVGGQPKAPRDKGSWRTVLIGGMRFGGAAGAGGVPAAQASCNSTTGYSAYFAIDVTDPEHPVPLWEFSDPDLGYTTSIPAVVRTGDNEKNGDWYVVFGTGSKALPKGSKDIKRSGSGYIYFVDLKTGELVKKAEIGNNAIVGDILSTDLDRDYESEKLYFGISYHASSKWHGKLIGMDVQENINLNANESRYRVLFKGDYPFTASPEVAKDSKGNVWVFAGSGKYYGDIDEKDKSEQIFLGMKDMGVTAEKNDLSDMTVASTEGRVSAKENICIYDSASNKFELKEVVTSINLLSGKPNDHKVGWVLSLKDGERVLSRPLLIGGLADFLTYKPDDDPCNYGGTSYLYSVGYTTGTAPSNISVRSPEITTEQGNGLVTVNKRMPLGYGAPPSGEAIITSQPGGTERLRKKIQIATGSVAEVENNLPYSMLSRIIHWLKK
jgi:type IV pilus assembly protein PilY1